MVEIGGWGVLDAQGQWLVWHVDEKLARKVYDKKTNVVLCWNIDTQMAEGGESHVEVERKGEIEFDRGRLHRPRSEGTGPSGGVPRKE